MFFTSVTVLLICDWFFIFSSSCYNSDSVPLFFSWVSEHFYYYCFVIFSPGKLFTSISLEFFNLHSFFHLKHIYFFWFSFCVIFFCLYKLGKTVTHPSLEGVSLCGIILMQSTLVGGLDMKEQSQATSSPGVQ